MFSATVDRERRQKAMGKAKLWGYLALGIALSVGVSSVTMAGGQGTPLIAFTSVPPYGSFEELKGQVKNVSPADYTVVVYIYVGGWWTKPYWSDPLTAIQDDSSWVCDITTGGSDEQATAIVAYLVPQGYDPPLMGGESTLPVELDQRAVAKVSVTRTPTVRTLLFSGYRWTVKRSVLPVGPGPNYFSESGENAWVDEQGQLHLKITQRDGRWYCSEVVSNEAFGYGKYIFSVASRVDQLNENVVLGLFTWDGAPEENHREIDIEFSRWGEVANENAQFVVQPWNRFGNMQRFPIQLNGDSSTHSFDWRSEYIFFQSLHGSYATPPDSSDIIASWKYTGGDIPRPGNENASVNLWLLNGTPPSDRKDVEIILKKFEFISPSTSVTDEEPPSIPTRFNLYQNFPNPFNSETTISYNLPKMTPIHLMIYDLTGRKIRTLVREYQQPGGLYGGVGWS
jgi:hypothetical protein